MSLPVLVASLRGRYIFDVESALGRLRDAREVWKRFNRITLGHRCPEVWRSIADNIASEVRRAVTSVRVARSTLRDFDALAGVAKGATVEVRDHARVRVQIGGVIDPVSTAFKARVESAVREALGNTRGRL